MGSLDSTLFGAGGEAGGSVDDPFVLDSSRNYGYGGVRALGLNGGLGRFSTSARRIRDLAPPT